MVSRDSPRTQYALIQESPLATIEMIDLVYGERDVVYGTLFADGRDDLDSQVRPLEDLELEFGFNPSHRSLEDETDAWPDEGKRQVSIAVGTEPEVVDTFLHHERNGNHSQVGRLLGYPSCCIEVFEAHFEEETATWTGSAIAEHVLNTTPQWTRGPFYANRFLRYEHSALLYHFPCHPRCEESIKIGKQRYNLLRDLDAEKAEAIKQVLSSAIIYRVTQDAGSDDILDVTDVVYCQEYSFDEKSKMLSIDDQWKSGRPEIDEDFLKSIQEITETPTGVTDFDDAIRKRTPGTNGEMRIVLFQAE